MKIAMSKCVQNDLLICSIYRKIFIGGLSFDTSECKYRLRFINQISLINFVNYQSIS